MRVVFRCEKCQYSNSLNGKFSNRREIENDLGESFFRDCTNCGANNSVNANKTRAVKGKIGGILFVLTLVITIVLSIILFQTYWKDKTGDRIMILMALGWIIAIPSLVLMAFNIEEQKSIGAFNSYYL